MAGKKSLPDVSQKVIANAEQYIAEFKRAARAQKGSTAEMDRELEKFTKGVKKKFSFGDIGKDMLKGFGIGSGFAVAEKAAEMIVGYYERAAKAAEAIDASTKSQLETTLKIIALHQTDEQRQATLEAEFARKGRELDAARAPTYKKQGRSTKGILVEKSTEEIEKIHALSDEYTKLGLAIEEARVKADKAEEARIVALNIATADADGDYTSRRRAARDDTDNWAVKMVEKEKEDKAKADLDLWEETAKAKRKALEDQIESGNKLFLEAQKKTEKEATEVAKSMQRSVDHAADAMGDAWVDAINGVEGAWGDLGKTVMREIEGIIAKVLIVTPLMHGLGSLFGSFGGGAGGLWGTIANAFSGYGKPAAAGGYRDGSQPYLVGEDGPEVFNPGRSGTIVPNHALRFAGAGGNTYNVDARGADIGVVERVQAALIALAGPGVTERRAMAAASDSRRRGG